MSIKLEQITDFLKKQDFNFKRLNDRFVVTRIATDGPALEQIIELSQDPGRITLHTVIHSGFKSGEIPQVLELASRFSGFSRFARAQYDFDQHILTIQVYMLTTASTFNKRQFFELQHESELAGAFLYTALEVMLNERLSPEASLERAYRVHVENDGAVAEVTPIKKAA